MNNDDPKYFDPITGIFLTFGCSVIGGYLWLAGEAALRALS